MNLVEVRIQKKLALAQQQCFSLDVQFSIPFGVTVIFGPSGAGKTMILDCIAGLAVPDSGTISIEGKTFYDSSSRMNTPVQHRHIGYVFQELALFPHMTAAQNIGFGVHARRQERSGLVRNALEKFRISGIAHHRPAQISGGERQRVALARALVTRPRLLLLDEPFSALDHALKNGIICDLKRWLNENSVPALLVTHDLHEARALGDRVLLLQNGKIVGEGDVHKAIPQAAGAMSA